VPPDRQGFSVPQWRVPAEATATSVMAAYITSSLGVLDLLRELRNLLRHFGQTLINIRQEIALTGGTL
jgi:hypothetical protein